MLARFAPKDEGGQGQDAQTGAELLEAGFDVRWVGPSDDPELVHGDASPEEALDEAEDAVEEDAKVYPETTDEASTEEEQASEEPESDEEPTDVAPWDEA